MLVWKMDPKTDHDWAGAVACCGVDNRGVAFWGNLVISHTLDGRLIATHKDTGQVTWQRQVADPNKGEVITGAPLIVKDMAITGVAGAEYGIRGWIAATDLNSQKEVWRTFTIPAKANRVATPGKTTGTPPRLEAVRHGSPVLMIRRPTPSCGAPVTPVRIGTMPIARATICTRTARSLSMPIPAKSNGTTSTPERPL